MSTNTTIYTVSGEVEPRPSGSVDVSLKSNHSGTMYTPYSSSDHEVTRLNALPSSSFSYPESENSWNSLSGRAGSSLSSSEYSNELMKQPSPVFGGYYGKNQIVDGVDERFKKLVYVVNADTITSGSNTFWNPADMATAGGYNSEFLGQTVDASPIDTFQCNIPVQEHGKIRDVRVWVELVHNSRDTGDTANGLKGVQISLVSPNVRGNGAYPIWSMPGARNFLYDANPNLTGADGLVGNAINSSQPEIYASGAYILWDGHDNPTTSYAQANLGLQGNWHEFDRDLDMRVIFSDNSSNANPRSRLRVFPNATEGSPGVASDLQNTLVSSTAGFQPLSYYYSPSNYAARNYSGTFNWNGPWPTVTGASVPWYVDTRLSNPVFNQQIIGAPPDGWVTGDPNALFMPWSSQLTSSTGTLWATTLAGSAAGNSGIYNVVSMSLSCTLKVGDAVRLVDSLTQSIYHDAVLSSITPLSTNVSYSDWKTSANSRHFIGVTPALAVSFQNPINIYASSQVSMTDGVAYGANSWSLGWTYTGAYKIAKPNLLYSVPFPPGGVPLSGALIKRNGRYYKVYGSTTFTTVYSPLVGGLVGYSVIYLDPGMAVLDPSITNWSGSAENLGNIYASGTVIYAATATIPASAEVILSSTYGLDNRWGFSYAFIPGGGSTSQMIMIGGYTGSFAGTPLNPANPLSGNFVDIINFSGSQIVSAYRSGVISNHIDDDGEKPARVHGSLFVANLGPEHAATFYVLAGGGYPETLAITQSSIQTFSTASILSSTWHAPYSYQYWREATYYSTTDGGGDYCVDPNTPVLVSPDKLVPIHSIQKGDKVWTKPEWGGELGYHEVDRMLKMSNLTNRITMNDGRSFVCSINHKLNVRGVWRRSDSLEPGEELQGEPGGIIKSVEYLGESPVIQIIIPTARTYFGGEGIWHHNAAPQKP